jgi:hypothetical protein
MEDFPRGRKSGESKHKRKICPDPEVCIDCQSNQNCIYLQNQEQVRFLSELMKNLKRRVDVAGTCLVNVRNLSRILSRTLDIDSSRISASIDETLEFLKAEIWGNACSDYRLKKWKVRTIGSKIYQIDECTVENLRWYIDKVKLTAGGENSS